MDKPNTYRVVSVDEAIQIVRNEYSYRIVREAGHPLVEPGEMVTMSAMQAKPVDNSNYCVVGKEMRAHSSGDCIFIVTDKAASDALNEERNKAQLAQKMAFMHALSFGQQ